MKYKILNIRYGFFGAFRAPTYWHDARTCLVVARWFPACIRTCSGRSIVAHLGPFAPASVLFPGTS